jgi:hypothetical protein
MVDFGSSEAGKKGGHARADALTPEQRSEIARRAVEARWKREGKLKEYPKATHAGQLHIGSLNIECAVLEDGTRVLSEKGFGRELNVAMGGYEFRRRREIGGGDLPIFLANKRLIPFISNELVEALKKPILFVPSQGGGTLANGIDAKLIPEICTVWLKAREAGAITPRQLMTASKAEIILRGLATVGIIALVDEATGFQDVRAADALVKILEAFVAKELQKWIQTFPVDYTKELCRLRGWPFKENYRLPRFAGKLTDDLVYKRLAPGVRVELRRLNPSNDNSQRRVKHFQWLTPERGHPKLQQHLAATVALMRVSSDWDSFMRLMDKALPRQPDMTLFEQAKPEELHLS